MLFGPLGKRFFARVSEWRVANIVCDARRSDAADVEGLYYTQWSLPQD